MQQDLKIGIFDSGLGGLTVFKEIVNTLPDYNYIYLGDSSRAPYGDHSFDTIFKYTLECVEWLFKQDCELVILACNTASAKALRTIQQTVLPEKYPSKRVLGVIRPTAEVIGSLSETKRIGVFGTRGTVLSNSYPLEIAHFFPEVEVYQQSCPMWVPLIENKEHLDKGADFFVRKYIDELKVEERNIDVVLLGCTHYPLLAPSIKEYIGNKVQVVSQAHLVAKSLVDYLSRHLEIDVLLSKQHDMKFYTTGNAKQFNDQASIFFDKEISSESVSVI